MKTRGFLGPVAVAAAIAVGAAVASWDAAVGPRERVLTGGVTAAWLADYHRELGYDLEDVRRRGHPVPRVILAELPLDLAKVEPTPLRKRLFIAGLLPVVLSANEAVAADRAKLEVLLAREATGDSLSDDERVWLDGLTARYAARDRADLLRRVDIVPPSLAIAQAAIESGWGSSRFAQEGNALFGQRVYGASAGGSGIHPAGLPTDVGFAVRSFASLRDSVAAYIHNLNTSAAYEGMRKRRADQRAKAAMPDGISLAAALHRYSELGAQYVAQVRDMIHANGLSAFDRARLAEDEKLINVMRTTPADRDGERIPAKRT